MSAPRASAAELAALGHKSLLEAGEVDELVAAATRDADPRCRSVALGALVRAAPDAAAAVWQAAVDDDAPSVRRRAAELAPRVTTSGTEPAARKVEALVVLLSDHDVTVVEAAAWALGELSEHTGIAVAALGQVARGHRDPLAREAAVAALGALGDPAGLEAILHACHDKPAVRRRAVLALAPFDGDAVEAALEAAANDRDWQVRQAAEDLRTQA